MSDTPYFDAYERRRRERNRAAELYRVRIGTGNTAAVELNYRPNVSPEWYSNAILEIYPKYRLQKTYTFIGDVRVIQDCFIESKASSNAEWVQVDESFNVYSFQ